MCFIETERLWDWVGQKHLFIVTKYRDTSQKDPEEAYPADEARQHLGSQRADTNDHELSIKL